MKKLLLTTMMAFGLMFGLAIAQDTGGETGGMMETGGMETGGMMECVTEEELLSMAETGGMETGGMETGSMTPSEMAEMAAEMGVVLCDMETGGMETGGMDMEDTGGMDMEETGGEETGG